MTPSQYEKMLHSIAQSAEREIRKNNKFKEFSLGVGASNKITGASGFHHQIDVSLKSESHLYLFECKLLSRAKVSVELVLVLAARLTDIKKAHQHLEVKATLVSSVGFTRGAEKLAIHFDIGREINRTDGNHGLQAGRYSTNVINGRIRASDRVIE
jgi:hypothetical protein